MKNNLKTKVMLAVLAGGMLCMNGAWADDTVQYWYGTTGGFVTIMPSPAVTTGINLTINDDTKNIGESKYTVDKVEYAIYGGYTSGNEAVSNNSITFNTTSTTTIQAIQADIYGGYSYQGNATGNSVTIKNGTFSNAIYGCYSDTGNATGNSVTIKNGTFSNAIYGGYSYNGNATGNSVTIQNGTFSNAIHGGYSRTGNATGNSVTIENGTFSNAIYGGWGHNTVGGDTPAEGNKVVINDGTFNSGAMIYGGYCFWSIAKGNSVIINGGTFGNNVKIYGGWYDVYGGGEADNNQVTINGGTFGTGTEIHGGYGDSNQVTINGGTFGTGTKIYGGTGTSSGNILNLKSVIGGKAAEVKYFQKMNFTLPSDIAAGNAMLKTATMIFDATNTTINVDASAVNLNNGDIITLIESDNAPTGVWSAGTVTGADGTITLSGNNLIFTLGGGSGDSATTKAVAEGVAASLAFVNQGADMVAGSGIDGLYVADSENPTIAAFSGNKTRYNTGRHVDIHGWNALAGVALNNKAGVSYGVFVEIGNGDIDTYAALNGSGSSDYKGGGFMVRKDLGKGWTIDGAVRAGRVETSWGNDTKGGYEAKQTYYGAHVTFNKMLKEYGEQKLNSYLRYTFTHLGSDSVNLDGTHYGFDSVNSHRTRLGARMVDEGQNGFELYYGAAWEYGFGGDCDATVNGVTTSGPAVDGSNAVFEVGGTWSDNKWEISAGLEGYAGAKRGAAGGMNFIYKF